MAIHPLTHQGEGFGTQLRHSRLGYSQLVSHILNRTFLKKYLFHHKAQTLRQGANRGAQIHQSFVIQQRVFRGGAFIGDFQSPVVLFTGGCIHRNDAASGILLSGLHRLYVHPQSRSEFLFRRSASRSRREGRGHFLQLFGALTSSAGRPVHRTQFVQHGSANPVNRVTMERHSSLWVISISGLHQGQRTRRSEILALYKRRDTAQQLRHLVTNQGEVFFN